MNEITNLSFALLGGLSLGAMFFGGLWWTVRRSMSAMHPAIWLFASLLLRMSATLAGFYWVGRGDWQRLVVCLAGFVLARTIVMWVTPPQRMQGPRGVGDAPES
jgi:F1F0 ATPase subunit 2